MTKKPTWQELLNIPNILTYFRFLFIPVFIWQYLHENYWLAGLALGLSALTDLLDGMIARTQEALGKKATAVATGGLAKAIVPYCRRKVILDDNLLLKGLLIIYNKNKG